MIPRTPHDRPSSRASKSRAIKQQTPAPLAVRGSVRFRQLLAGQRALRPHHPCSIRQPEPERRREPARRQGPEREPERGPEPEQRPEPASPAGSCPRRTATEPHRPEPEHSTTERPAHKPGRTEPGRPEHSTTERPERSAKHRPERPEHSTTEPPERSTTERPERSTSCAWPCSNEPHQPYRRSRTPPPTSPDQTVYHSCEILL
jgi:hypothetical protein